MNRLAERFGDALEQVGGRVHRVTGLDDAGTLLRELVADRAVVADDDPVVAAVTAGLSCVHDPWQAEVGVTTAVAAAADTGTLALGYDAAHPRSTSLVPPVHVAVVPADRLVPDYAAAVAALAALCPLPSGMQLITGPSTSGDIEMIQVRGVHGPVEVHVILLDGEEGSVHPP